VFMDVPVDAGDDGVVVAVLCVVGVRASTVINIDVTIVKRVGAMTWVLIDLLADTMIDFVTNIDVGALAGVDASMVAAAMADPDFIVTRVSLEDPLRFCCWAARSCWSIAALNCLGALQARMPSYHVCSTFVLPAPPQVPNQEPPRPQQLIFPDLRMTTHVVQTELMDFVVTAECSHMEYVHQTRKQRDKRSVKKVVI